MVWVYSSETDKRGEEFWTITDVVEEFNPDLNMLAGMYPDAIYFYAELVTPDV